MEPQASPEQATPKEKKDSAIASVSVRAWLAIMLTITVCIMSVMDMSVKEPLYTLATAAISFYVGQNNKK